VGESLGAVWDDVAMDDLPLDIEDAEVVLFAGSVETGEVSWMDRHGSLRVRVHVRLSSARKVGGLLPETALVVQHPGSSGIAVGHPNILWFVLARRRELRTDGKRRHT
jgi:hypothetical protein